MRQHKYKRYSRGWFNESLRHSLASKGIKTVNNSFNKGEKFMNEQFRYGKKGDIISIYYGLLLPKIPVVDYNKNDSLKVNIIKGPEIKGKIMVDLDVIKKRHPREFKIISNESYGKLYRTGLKLNPNEDTDNDGVINKKDARPLNNKDFRDDSFLQKIADSINNN